jgi:mRNA interferase HicA
LMLNTNWCTVTVMRRKKLEIELKKLGWWLLRHGGKHDVWTDGNRQEPIPRHSDINEKLARSILRKAKRGDKK